MRVSRVRLLAASLFLSVPLAAQERAPFDGGASEGATTSAAIPSEFVAQGTTHRLFLEPNDPALAELARSGALRRVEHYGSFVMIEVALQRAGGLEALLARGATLADAQTLINLNGYLLDGADAVATRTNLAAIPEEMRAPESAPLAGERRMRLVQFDGPIKDEWLDTLRSTGVRVVTYVANNAYVVVADSSSHGALEQLVAKPYVLGISNYEPAFKLRPELRVPALQYDQIYDVIVQIVADEQGQAFAQELADRSFELLVAPHRVLEYIDIGVRIDGANVLELARDPRVFAIEPKLEARLFDEAQGQIMAANLNAAGTQPTGPGYLAWLQSQGFPGSNPFTFSVDVHDDGVDRGSTTDVNTEFKVDGLAAGASRVMFNNNYSGDALADGRAGHGNINASIIGGYNDTAGSAFEDASGYQYGLGIAPWVRLGNSKVFSNAGSGVFNQPTLTRMGNAYSAGARISSNSWGYTSGNNYNADTQAHDTAVRDAVSGTAGNQELSIIFAAGNSGSGAGTVHPPGTGKNVLTVGASENYRMTGTDGCAIGNTGADNAMDIISFSGRGPTSDARKKPEIVAPGTHIEGAASRATGYDGTGVCNQYWPSGQTLYAWSSGTSHSTPAVAGFAALIRQDYINNGLSVPSPAMVKAEVVSGAVHMNGVGANDTLWSNSQGFGRTNMARTFDSAARLRVDQTTVLAATGNTYTTSGSISNTTLPFRVALVWTDAPGATTGNAYVNNLDLEVTVNGTLYRGNVFSGANSVSGGTADAANNTECVFLPVGTSGSFSVTVRGTNIAGDGVPGNADTTDQDFALLVYNGSASAPTPDFTLAATPSSQTITAGNATSYTVSNTALNGFAGSVTLSATPAISGVTYGFTANPIAANGSTTMSVTSTSAATPGTYNVTISGVSGSLTRTANVTLVVNAPPTPTFTLSATPASQTITAGGSTSYTASTAAQNGFSGSVALSVSPAISGVSFGFSPASVAVGGSSTLSVTTTTAATAGTHTLTITGVSGSITRTQNVTLVINPVGGGSAAAKTYSAAPALAVPDNNTTGVTSTLNVADALTISSIAVDTVIPHTYKGDLVVTLIGPDNTSAILHNRSGGSTDNVTTTFSILTAPAQALSVFNGKSTAGAWKLKVQDLAAADTGTLSSWKITFNGEKSASPSLAIPDNNTTGVTSTLTYTGTGTVAAVKVRVNVTHTYKGDLEIALIGPDNTTVLLHNRTGGATDNVNTEFPDLTVPAQSLSAFTGKAISGGWKLRVRDLAATDTGTLVSWTLSLQAQ
ncbi:MAG: proprotein convertase P-domain-containing protein [Planctomycetes bacterium]|nr:proprotein convertase P-domain-containing protein [Planctomycetota bacterium]